MSWSNVRLILAREIRDQLRDRRTLFMIVVLPILLYPLLGMTFFQVAQFMKEQPTRVLVVGARHLAEEPPLVVNERFAPELFDEPDKADLLELVFEPSEPLGPRAVRVDPLERAHEAVTSREYDAALYIPPDFAERLEEFREASLAAASGEPSEGKKTKTAPAALPAVPKPEIIFTTANERSQITFVRLQKVLRRWSEEVGKRNLAAAGVAPETARPFDLGTADLASQTGNRGTAIWSKILPVMLLLWALTGAFYPAVDLCAGEKERGTLETLLSSPAERSEIVLGKLVTVMLFSVVTVILNLASIGLTGWLIMAKLPGLGAPPWTSIIWLLLALLPVSALFSALCLALAAFAKSTKEGQYYLMPLLLVTMPLAIFPLAPGVTLTLGNSLIPVTNVVLLLRSTLEGNYQEALRYVLPVVGVTLVGCLLAIRWAVDQFNKESVLFRESERLDLGLWLRHLLRDRQPTPTVAAAAFCGVLILVVKFFVGLAMPEPTDFVGLAKAAIATQLVVIATPALLMTIFFTNRPSRTLLLDRRSWRAELPLAVAAAAVLAVVLHPVAMAISVAIVDLYPVTKEVEASFKNLMGQTPDFWQLLLIAAVLPALCEELAFRGFILSGFRHVGRKWRAIVLSAVFFGFAHGILQQSISACLMGVVLGFLAVQTGSLIPCIVYHATHNALALTAAQITPGLLNESPFLNFIVRRGPDGAFACYKLPLVVLAVVLALMILTWFGRLRYEKTEEERLQEAIQRGIEAEDEPLGL
ncbi:MAG: CPBP family intramembrane metalloprotease [Pirellulales bacterium]|nr:CPBP family intramembrane metalloprotease [Pirellulales bacterium]